MLTSQKQAGLAKIIQYGLQTSELKMLKENFSEVPEIILLLIVGHSGARVAETILGMENKEMIENASILLSISPEDLAQIVTTSTEFGVSYFLEILNQGMFLGTK